jgi:hypothetical protein
METMMMKSSIGSSLVMFVCSAQATVHYYVDDDGSQYPTADFASIQEAINDFIDPVDDAIIHVAPGIYNVAGLPGNYVFNTEGKSVQILGDTSFPGECVIDGSASIVGLVCSNGENSSVLVKDLVFQNCISGIYCAGNAAPTIADCTIRNCVSSALATGGAGLLITNGAHPSMSGMTIFDCHAPVGAGISISNGAWLSLTNSTIEGCSATAGSGGGILLAGNALIEIGQLVSILNCHAHGPDGVGGGLAVAADSMVNWVGTMGGGSIDGCSATLGGGIVIAGGSHGNLTDVTINNCHAYSGGAIFLNGDPITALQDILTATNLHITSCTATGGDLPSEFASSVGGGIYAQETTSVELDQSTVMNCTAFFSGGGIYAGDVELLKLTSTTLDGNTTILAGGGIRCQSVGSCHVEGGQWSSNTALYGGGAFLQLTSVYLEDLSVVGNIGTPDLSGPSAGAAMYLAPAATDTIGIWECRINANSATNGWGDAGAIAMEEPDGQSDMLEVWYSDFCGNYPAVPVSDPLGLPISYHDFLNNYSVSLCHVCVGDMDGNAMVDLVDLLALLQRWATNDTAGDINQDQTVDVLDILDLLEAWGSCSP